MVLHDLERSMLLIINPPNFLKSHDTRCPGSLEAHHMIQILGSIGIAHLMHQRSPNTGTCNSFIF